MSRNDYPMENFRASPRFSFIIVSYNTLALTRAAILSIGRSAQNLPHEIIIVDNHSADKSVSVLREEFPQLKIIAFEENRGYATACNAGAKQAESEWLIFLNSDAELLPDTMNILDDLLRKHPEIKFFGGQLLNFDGSLQRSVILYQKDRHFEERHQNKELMTVPGFIGAFMLVHRALWLELNGMDEGYFFYGEERDLVSRVVKTGALIHWSPQVRILHHRAGSSRKVNLKADVEFWTSLHYSLRKSMSDREYRATVRRKVIGMALRVIWYFTLALLTVFLLRAFTGRFRKYFHLLVWHLRGRPASWGLRPVK